MINIKKNIFLNYDKNKNNNNELDEYKFKINNKNISIDKNNLFLNENCKLALHLFSYRGILP